MSNDRFPIRVLLQQPALPRYRVPVFAELAKRSNIALRVAYGEVGGLTNAVPEGFAAWHAPSRRLKLSSRELRWTGVQWSGASRRECDVLILSWNLNDVSLVPSLIRAKASGVRTILWGHGFGKNDRGWRSRPRRLVTGLADATLFYDRATADRYVEQGADPASVFVAQNAVDERPVFAAREAFLARPGAVESFRREQSIGEGPLLLFVSRLTPKVRLELLLEAMAKLRITAPDICIAIIGDGDTSALRDLARRLGIERAVRFLGGIYLQDELAPWFCSADAFCYPSGIGLSIFHAFAYGLPVVTSDNRAVHNPEFDALSPGSNGLTYRDGDADSLAATLNRLVLDRALRDQLSRGAIESIRNRYNIRTMVDGFEAAIRYVMSRQGR